MTSKYINYACHAEIDFGDGIFVWPSGEWILKHSHCDQQHAYLGDDFEQLNDLSAFGYANNNPELRIGD